MGTGRLAWRCRRQGIVVAAQRQMAGLDSLVKFSDELLIVDLLVITEMNRFSDKNLDLAETDRLGISRPRLIGAVDCNWQQRGFGTSGEGAETGL